MPNPRPALSLAAVPGRRAVMLDVARQAEALGFTGLYCPSLGDHAAVPGLMSDDWLADVTLFGTADEVRAGLDAWFDAGVTTPVLVPSSAAGNQMTAYAEVFALYRD